MINGWREKLYAGSTVFCFILLFCTVFLSSCQNEQVFDHSGTCNTTGIVPKTIFIQPSFTQVVGDPHLPQPDKIKVYLALKDKYEDPLKALGSFRFEMFQYRPAYSDPRGRRYPEKGLQVIDLTNKEDNQNHWDKTTRNYHFSLDMPELLPGQKKFVLQVTFIDLSQTRYENMLVLSR